MHGLNLDTTSKPIFLPLHQLCLFLGAFLGEILWINIVSSCVWKELWRPLFISVLCHPMFFRSFLEVWYTGKTFPKASLYDMFCFPFLLLFIFSIAVEYLVILLFFAIPWIESCGIICTWVVSKRKELIRKKIYIISLHRNYPEFFFLHAVDH